MNPFLQQVIGAIVRAAVLWAAGYLAAHAGITLSDDQVGKIVAYLVPVLAVLAWSVYQKFVTRQKLLTAQLMRPGVTEHDVEAKLNDPSVPKPSVLTPKNQVPS